MSTTSDVDTSTHGTLVYGAAQEVAHTASRWSAPRKWLAAVRWLIGAGLHPRANATTQRVADDLAARMDYSTGHVRYCEADMVTRTGISRANLYRHVGYLRELGALAYVQHGSRKNVRAAMGLKGYAATATEYAAVIPAAYDDAMGHRIVGAGYSARIVIDMRDCKTSPKAAPKDPVDTPGNSPVDNSGSSGLETPSLTWVKEESQVDLVGGVTTTATRTRNDSTPTPTPKSSSRKRATILGRQVTAAGMQLGDKLAHAIRRRVPWTRNASHGQLRWVCADMGEQQWTEDQAVRFVVEAGHTHKAGYGWDPNLPHRLIAAELLADRDRQAEDAQHRAAMAVAIPWEESTAYREQQAARAALEALLDAEGGEVLELPKVPYTAEEKLRARMDWNVWPEVLDHLAEDQDDAIDLYGEPLCKYAIDKGARTRTDHYSYL